MTLNLNRKLTYIYLICILDISKYCSNQFLNLNRFLDPANKKDGEKRLSIMSEEEEIEGKVASHNISQV